MKRLLAWLRARRWGKRARLGLSYRDLHPEALRRARRREYAVKPKERQKGRE